MTPTLRLTSLLGACLLVGCASTAPSGPQDTPVYGKDTGPPRHHVAVFGGASTANDGDADGTTFGGTYEFRVDPGWGLGGFIDSTGGDLDTTRYGGALFLHPAENWVGMVGYGLADKISTNLTPAVSGTDSMVRAGGGYELYWGSWTITPAVYIDWIDGTKVWVYGVGLGRKF